MRKIIRLVFLTTIIGCKALLAQQEVTFSLAAVPGTKSVHVAGDFNHWSKTAHPMSDLDRNGIWKTMMLLKPGTYEYRFLLDTMIWIKDPLNLNWGGEHSNSILRVKSPQQPEVKYLKPEMGAAIRSRNCEVQAQYIDGLEKHGLDLDNTKILLNGQPQKFSFNNKLHRIECNLNHLEDGEYHIEIQAQDLNRNQSLPVTSYFIINNSNSVPVADAGYTIITGVNSIVKLNTGSYYDPAHDPIHHYQWKLIAKPGGSNAKLVHDDVAFPEFRPDKMGRYLFTLQVSNGNKESAIDSVDVYAFIKRDYPVEFNLSDSAFAAIYEVPIESVVVAGEFNRWSAATNPMNDYNHDGIWTAWIDLDPGEYEYKFVVNGEHWITDPQNPVKVPDGWNGFNSVIAASLNLAPVIAIKSHLGPGKIILDASASYTRASKNLTFLWFQDINNPQRFELPSLEKVTISTPKQSGTYYFYLVAVDQFGVSSQKTMVLNIDNGTIKIRDFSDSPDWAKDVIMYEVLVRRFTPEGTFKGLIEKIAYLKILGVNCIWLMPVWDGPTSHGYGPSSCYAIEQDYGTLADFRELVVAAHQAGIRIILDFVANHTSDQHPYFLSAYCNPNSNFRNWYRWHDQDKEKGYYTYEFHNDWDTLPNLNYENPNLRRYIIDVATYWAGLGVDGFRCDVAWGIPHDFWKLFRRSLKNINPDFLTINEVLPRSPAYHKDEFDVSYDTDFYGNLLDVMKGRKPLSAIEYGLRKTQKNYPPFSLDFRYIENHDMDRFVTQFGLNKTKIAATLLLTIPGIPLIYYGQEIGLREKTPRMDWNKQDDWLFDFYKKLISLRRHHSCFRRGEMMKVPTNAEESVYAYLRKGMTESLLVVLNLGDRKDDCQLLFPEGILNHSWGKQLQFENVLSSELMVVDLIGSRKIKLKLEAETPYIFKWR